VYQVNLQVPQDAVAGDLILSFPENGVNGNSGLLPVNQERFGLGGSGEFAGLPHRTHATRAYRRDGFVRSEFVTTGEWHL
jgi:hypothetical protein